MNHCRARHAPRWPPQCRGPRQSSDCELPRAGRGDGGRGDAGRRSLAAARWCVPLCRARTPLPSPAVHGVQAAGAGAGRSKPGLFGHRRVKEQCREQRGGGRGDAEARPGQTAPKRLSKGKNRKGKRWRPSGEVSSPIQRAGGAPSFELQPPAGAWPHRSDPSEQ